MPNKKDTIKIINNFLSDVNTTKRVLVLKGNWGTGKTWLWKQEIVPQQPLIKKIGYVSLFGKSTIQDINKAALSAVYLANKASKITHKARQFTNALNTVTENFAKLNTAVQGIDALLSVINRENLENTIICFDDLERMDKNIDFQDFLGFVNDLAEHHECKVVLIFNEDELFKKQDDETSKNKEYNKNTTDDNENKNAELDEITKENIYNKYKEKTIDIEVTYTPNFEDNFEIAYNIIKSDIDDKYISIAKNVLQELNENNIRIIKKCIECINDFMHAVENIKDKIYKYEDFSNTIFIRIIESITFITHQYWKAGHKFWDSEYVEKITKNMNDKEFLLFVDKFPYSNDYIYQGKYLETVEIYFQGLNFDENILLKYLKDYDLLTMYYNFEKERNKYEVMFWKSINGKLDDYVNNMCKLFENEDNAYSFFINVNYPALESYFNDNTLLKRNDNFKEIFNKQMKYAVNRYIQEYQNIHELESDYDIQQKIELIDSSVLELLYKKPNSEDNYFNLLNNILRGEHLKSSKYLIEKLEYDKYVELCNENNEFFIRSKSLFFERDKYELSSKIPHFLYITAKYLLETIEINSDNEMKYDILGKHYSNKDNYSAKKDLEEYIVLYESNHPKK